MKDFFVILLTGMLTENLVLSKFMGICTFLGVSKKIDSASGMGIAVTFVMICATIVTYPIYHLILIPNNIDYLRTIVFILIIALFVQLVEIALKKLMPPLYKSLGVYLPLITTNCAVLGITLLNFQESFNFIYSLANALGAGLGFMLAMIIFAGIRTRLEKSDVPEFLKGLPITLIAAGIVSLSFLGFAGLV